MKSTRFCYCGGETDHDAGKMMSLLIVYCSVWNKDLKKHNLAVDVLWAGEHVCDQVYERARANSKTQLVNSRLANVFTVTEP